MRPERAELGILPAGALGAAFFYHVTRGLEQVDGFARFYGRPGSLSARAQAQAGSLRYETPEGERTVAGERIFAGELGGEGVATPHILLVCVNPDQLLEVAGLLVELVERAQATGQPLEEALPLTVFCTNGIYFQRLRQVFLERLEESILLGRLPDLWPEVMPRLVSRLYRGATLQTGLRRGSGVSAVYRAGPAGSTQLAGGAAQARERIVTTLHERGLRIEDAGVHSPTRVEFDKGLVNLAGNLLGLIESLQKERFEPLTVGQIFLADGQTRARELTRHVLAVGQAVRAYPPELTEEELFGILQRVGKSHAAHVPSSLQWVESQLAAGTLRGRMTPNEQWLLDPLIHYATNTVGGATARYFMGLRRTLEELLRKAAQKANG